MGNTDVTFSYTDGPAIKAELEVRTRFLLAVLITTERIGKDMTNGICIKPINVKIKSFIIFKWEMQAFKILYANVFCSMLY